MAAMSTPGGPPGSADAERWAPFPVQDWSTLPDRDRVPGPYGYVDPGWAPPAQARDPRPGWLPLLVVILVAALVAGSLVVAEWVGGAAARSEALDYVPADGAAGYQQRVITVGSSSTSRQLGTESARLTGATVLGGLDWNLGAAVLNVVGADELDRMRFWRTTTTELGILDSSQQQVRVYRTDAAVELIAESGPGGAAVYSPALVELPARVAAGDRWQGAGTVGSRRYRSEFRASSASPGCVQVSGTIVETTSAGQPSGTRRIDKTWCARRGVQIEQSVRGEVATRVQSISAPAADRTLRTAAEDWTWSDPATWRRRDYDLMSVDENLGSGPMAGSPAQVPPVLTASGLMIRPTSGDDLVAATPKTVDRWTSLWRMHPGGTVLTLAAFGDVLVTTTSQRRVVAYSDAGVRLWSLTTDEIAFGVPVAVGSGRIAIADAGGGVRVVELLTGDLVWQAGVGAQVSAPLVGDSRVVVVLDAGGTATVFATDSGARRWTKDVPGDRGAILGDTLVVHNAATLEALDVATGRHRWLRPQTGTLDALQPFGDTLVVASQLGTVVLAEDGSLRQRLPSYEWVSVVGDTVVGWGRTEAEFRDDRLALLATIDTPDLTLGTTGVPPLVYRQGVFVFGRGWTFTGWSDEP
jgi:outer membrane protein assembly factor BamB